MSMIAWVYCCVLAFPPKSPVRVPSAMVCSAALWIRSANESSFMCRSIIILERRSAVGLARLFAESRAIRERGFSVPGQLFEKKERFRDL